MTMRVTILGSGTSGGVPVPSCPCQVCRSADPHDHRLRASLLVERGTLPPYDRSYPLGDVPQLPVPPDEDDYASLLVDCGPDFRYQALRHGLRYVSAVLLTHLHFDHFAGLDDLRIYSYAKPLPFFAEDYVADQLLQKYDYVFAHPYPGAPHIALHPIQADDAGGPLFRPFRVSRFDVTPIRLMHGQLPILGYRIGSMAYLTDCTAIPESEYAHLGDVSTLVIDALRWEPHRTHFSVGQALDVVERLRPAHTLFTHMNHDIGLHQAAEARLQEVLRQRGLDDLDIHFAYDGQTFLTD